MRAQRPSLFVGLFGFATRSPRGTLFVAACCTVLGIIGTARLRPATSVTAMLAGDDPDGGGPNRAFARVVSEFGAIDDLIVLATLGEINVPDNPKSRDRLRAFAQRLEAAIRQSPEASSLCRSVVYRDPPQFGQFVESEMLPAGLFYVDDAVIPLLRKRLSKEGMQEQFRRNEELLSTPGVAGSVAAKAIVQDPLHLYELIEPSDRRAVPRAGLSGDDALMMSHDGRSVMIRIAGLKPATELGFAARLMDAIRGIVQRVNDGGLEIEYAGGYAIAVEAQRSIRGDLIRSLAMSFVMLLFLFLFVYRRWLSFPLAVTPVAIGIVVAFGISSLHSTHLTPLAAVIGALLAGLGIDYCIHLLSHYTSERASGCAHGEAVENALVDVGPAMVAACITSVVGFLAISQSSVPALRQFALIGVLGLCCALTASLTVLPALLTLVAKVGDRPNRGEAAQPRLEKKALVRPLTSLLAGLAAYRRWSMAGSILLVLAAITVLGLSPGGALQFETDLTVMHPRPNPPLDAQREIARRFGHPGDTLLVYLEAQSPDELVMVAHRVDERMRSDAVGAVGVTATFGLASLLPDPAKMTAREDAIRSFDVERIRADFESVVAKSVFNPDAFARFLESLEALLTATRASAPTISTLLRYPELAHGIFPTSVSVGTPAPTESITLVFFDEPLEDQATFSAAIDALRRALDDIPGATLTGLSVIGRDAERAIRHDLPRLLILAAVVVFAWLLCYFRRLDDAFLALLPALFGLVTLLGVMSLAGLRLNTVNLIGLPLLVGIGVDDGIFLVSLVRSRRRPGHVGPELIHRLGTACHAVLMTTLTTIVTFGTLVFTSTPAIQSLGIMLTIGMVACLIGTLFLLAPILMGAARLGRSPSP